MTDLERLLLEEIPTGHFGSPRPKLWPTRPSAPTPDPNADAHRRALAEAIRRAA